MDIIDLNMFKKSNKKINYHKHLFPEKYYKKMRGTVDHNIKKIFLKKITLKKNHHQKVVCITFEDKSFQIIIYKTKNISKKFNYYKLELRNQQIPIVTRRSYPISNDDLCLEISFYNKFLRKNANTNEATIDWIINREGCLIKKKGGTVLMNLALILLYILNVKNVYLHDMMKTFSDYPDFPELDLRLFKIITTGKSWYEKFGFKNMFKKNNTDYKKIYKLSIKRLQHLKITDLKKTLTQIKKFIQKITTEDRVDDYLMIHFIGLELQQKTFKDFMMDLSHIETLLNLFKKYNIQKHTMKTFSLKLFKENEYHLYLFYNILFRDLFNGENIGIKKISKKISLLDDIIFEFDWKIYELGINNDQQNYYIREF